jgi:hypothetical protein
LFVVLPQVLLVHAFVLSGVQHVSLARHTSTPGQAGHVMVWPQLFVADVLHLLAHAVWLSGVQQLVPTQTSDADEQLGVPPAPHATVWPPLFVVVPQVLPAHVVAIGSGTQPHAPASLHVSPPSQPPQLTACPQLLVLDPHRFWHHVADGSQHALLVQTPPSAQVAGHWIVCAQLFVALTPHLPAHGVALSGAQQVPFVRHTSPLVAHDVDPLAPHATV